MKMKENKKRYMIAIVAFVVFAVLFALGLKANSLYSNSLSNKQMSAQKDNEKSSQKVSKDSTNVDKNGKNNKGSSAVKSSDSSGKSSEASLFGKGSSAGSSSKTGSSSSKTDNPSTVTSSGVVKVSATDPESRATFQIIDTVHGNKMILAKNIDKSMDGEMVGYITERILDDAKMNYRATGAVSTLYFAAIDGLEEKKAGKFSGWCYYIRKSGDNVFHKPNIGCGQWVWHSGDVVVWRYLADGIYDGYEGEWETK
jgi:hypothetical protein